MPPLPPWNQIHPLVIHFPIALTFLVPVFLLLAAVIRKARLSLLFSAALIAVLAAVGSAMATSSGEAGEDAIPDSPLARQVLHEHEELGELARNINIGAALLLTGSWLTLWLLGPKVKAPIATAALVVLTLAYTWPVLAIAQAGHEGGRLVHELGTQAWATPAPGNAHD
jgi:uncharacterized membrane protein